MTTMPHPATFGAPLIPNATDVRHPVTLWEMLCWTYGPQRAGRLGLGRTDVSRMRWANCLISLDADGPRPTVHPDAAAVHRVVAGLLREDVAWLVIEAAEAGVQPERSVAQPQPVARLRDGHGGAQHAVDGQWVEVPAIRLTAAERRKLSETDDHGEVERYAVPGGAHRWRYRVDLRPRRRCKRAILTAVDGQVMDRSVGFARGDQVWSAWCPLDYSPDPAFVAAVNAVADAFADAMETLADALEQVPFRTRRLVQEDRHHG